MNIDEIKKAGEDAFAKLKLSISATLNSSVPVVVSTGAEYVAKAQQRFSEIMSIILNGDLDAKDGVQFFLNRMEDEKNIIFGMFLYLEVVAKGDIETLATNVQSILVKSATDFLNTVQL